MKSDQANGMNSPHKAMLVGVRCGRFCCNKAIFESDMYGNKKSASCVVLNVKNINTQLKKFKKKIRES